MNIATKISVAIKKYYITTKYFVAIEKILYHKKTFCCNKKKLLLSKSPAQFPHSCLFNSSLFSLSQCLFPSHLSALSLYHSTMGLSILSHRRWCRSLIIQVGFFDFSFFETKFEGGGGLNSSHVNGGARKFVHQS